MTVIQNDSPKALYTAPSPSGYAIGQLLPITFPYADKTDVKVKIGSSIATSADYEIVTDPPNATPDSITLKKAVAAGTQITIYRETPIDQQSVYPQNAKFRSEQVESDFDKVCMIQQEHHEELGRCLRVPVDAPAGFDGQLPTPSAGKGLIWNEAGTGFTNTTFDVTDLEEAATAIHESLPEIHTVAAHMTDIEDVLEDMETISAVAADLENIDAASTHAANALAYKNQAGSYATAAGTSATLCSDLYTSTLAAKTEAVSVIQSTTSAGLSSIGAAQTAGVSAVQSSTSSGLTSIQAALTTSLGDIESAKDIGINSIIAVKTSAISDIGDAKDTALSIVAASTTPAQLAAQSASASASAAGSYATQAATSATRAAGWLTSVTQAGTDAVSNINTARSDAEASIQYSQSVIVESTSIITESTASVLAAATQAEDAATNAEIWAEGNDDEVEQLGGTHSAKGWVESIRFGNALEYEDNILTLKDQFNNVLSSVTIQEGSGGGGGGGPATFTVTTEMDDILYYASGQPAVITCNYNSSENARAVAQYIINGQMMTTLNLTTNGNFSKDVSEYLQDGTNYLQIKVMDENSSVKSVFFTINTVAISISSTFDSSLVYTSPITFRYTPIGNVTKTIHFELDGVETTETTATSGRQMSKILTLDHGVHVFRVWVTATIGEVDVISNVLFYEIMYAATGGTLIASEFRGAELSQGESVTIPFSVYNPASLTTEVSVYVNNVLTSQLVVDRTRQNWTSAINTYGTVVVRFEAGGATRSFTLTVEQAEIDIQPVTENLELFLTAAGRSNSDLNKEQWSYENINCTLSGFNYVTNGWLNNALKVSNGASVTIPFQPFAEDFRAHGKTIEIEFSTSNVLNYDTTVLSCFSGNRGIKITAQSALLKSEQSQVSTKYKEDEKIRISFVVEDRSANRLIYTYINGIISGLAQYPSNDDFHQTTPVNITIGSSDCDVDIYNIRVYDSYLSRYDILNNFIADTANLSERLAKYARNNIYDAYNNVLYNRVLNELPIMTITGELPPTKGNKKLVTVKYENEQDSSRDFEMQNVTLDIQGTSSQYYPKKNYKISKLPTAYSLRVGSIPEKVFTMKADYMESSHAHNTGLARLVNELYETLTPPQEGNPAVRTAIDGFPAAIYYRLSSSVTPYYFGVYNFNNDKSSNDTFGFTEGCESWEWCNNTSPRCLFKSADFSNSADVLTDFEARYPDGNTNTNKLHTLVTWVNSCDSTAATGDTLTISETIDGVTYTTDSADYRIAKFKNELEDHFNLDFVLTYYIFSEFFGMVDSRCKNMFLNYYTSDQRWYPVFYDLDTAIGLNNEGVNEFGFDIEYHDTIGTENVFNGESSVLWNMVEKAYGDELAELYNSLRNSGKLTYNNVMQYLDTDQIEKICEALYNEDCYFKYISPLIDDGIATYLYTAQGSRINHIKWWIANRFNYLDSKYIASDYKDNYITLRLYTPSSWEDVEPDADITLTTYIDQYCKIKYGSYVVGEKSTHNVATTIEAPAITFNDTETIIYGADKILSIGDLSPLYAGTIDVSKATKLSTLTIGHGGDYSNTNLRNLALGNNNMLKYLDVRNCPNLTNALDVSGCPNLLEIKATGTSITSATFPEAGYLTTLQLPDTITNLTIKNQNSITTFTCGYTNITTLVIENCNLDSKTIFSSCTNLTKVRLIGIDWTLGSSFALLDRAYALLGQDENGYNTAHGILAGTVRMSGVRESAVQPYRTKFIGLNFVLTDVVEEDYICTDFGEVITTHDGNPLIYT